MTPRPRRRSSPERSRTTAGPWWSAPGPTARASFRRSSRCPGAAPWTSRSGSTSHRTGRTWAEAVCVRAEGIKPNVYAYTPPGRQDRRRPVRGRANPGGADQMNPAAAAARVAVIERRGKFLVAEPFFSPGPRLAVTRDRQASVGDLVVLAPQSPRSGRSRGRGRAVVARRLGRPDVARNVIEALMVERGLRRAFDPAVEREARMASQEVRPGERRDLRSLVTFTIDPASARDFDDAISAASEGPDRWRVWVHIADVSAYVPPGSLVDREAYRRATSVYVPGAVEPMLPESLSAGACSLVPGQDRLAVTVEMVVEGDRVRTSSFYRSLIRSDERLDYPRVDRIFAGAERALEPVGGAIGRRPGCGGGACRPAGCPSSHRARNRGARVHLRRRGQRGRRRAGAADRGPPADRAPDDRGQRAGGRRARIPSPARSVTACTSGPRALPCSG